MQQVCISEHFGGWFWPTPYSNALLQAAQSLYALSKYSQNKIFRLKMVEFGKQHLEESLCTEKKTAGCSDSRGRSNYNIYTGYVLCAYCNNFFKIQENILYIFLF